MFWKLSYAYLKFNNLQSVASVFIMINFLHYDWTVQWFSSHTVSKNIFLTKCGFSFSYDNFLYIMIEPFIGAWFSSHTVSKNIFLTS